MKIAKFNKGMVLPLVIVLSLIILTSIGFWYRKILIQSFLSERLILQRSNYNECKSLMPVLKRRLDNTPFKELEQSDHEFLTVKSEGKTLWSISRSALIAGKIEFVFDPQDVAKESLRLTMGYAKKMSRAPTRSHH